MNKAERLAIASAIAPVMRENHQRAKARRVHVVDKDGNVKGHATLEELQRGILQAHAIEIETREGVRPTEVMCKMCGLPIVGKTIRAKYCNRCRSCSKCGAPVNSNTLAPAVIARRKGAPPTCFDCHQQDGVRLALASARAHAKTKGTKRAHATSQYHGVCWLSTRERWVAVVVRFPGKQLLVGTFKDELEAARAYDQAACDMLGINAKLNFGEYI